jgi:RsiW-degrading membrane proteinase PrsW (M82 family)
MTDSSYPPPPPPPTSAPQQRGLYGPETSWFLGIRRQLAILEQPPQFKSGQERSRGLFVAFITSGVLGFLLAYFIELALSSATGLGWMLTVVGPIIEEPAKALGVLAVALFVWRAIPDRRHGAALGAAAGFGFGVAEDILYAYSILSSSSPELVVNRIPTPFAHAIWSALVAIGVFALLAKKASYRRLSESFMLASLFLLIGIGNHILWNSFPIMLPALGFLWGLPYVETLLNVLILMPFSALLLRDFLGGHFNFQNFFEAPKQQTRYPTIPPPPPPPPPP